MESGQDRRRELQEAIAGFSAFDCGDDSFSERDFGALTLWGARLCWKIDYFAPEGEELPPRGMERGADPVSFHRHAYPRILNLLGPARRLALSDVHCDICEAFQRASSWAVGPHPTPLMWLGGASK